MDRRAPAALLALVAIATVAALTLGRHPSTRELPSSTGGGVDRVEGCLSCHDTTQGLGPPHANIGCSPCHGGDPESVEEAAAHRGMEVLAGDLSSVGTSCGRGDCHPVETARVRSSLMARAPGILAVTRFAFGESSTPDGDEHDALSALDQDGPVTSRAESYVRQLCGSCHLGARKTERGDHGELARGGGCTACHLAAPYAGRPKADGPLHPDVSAVVSERRCFGCHSRSGRIALSFHGVVELEPGDPRVTRKLADGRPVGSAAPDVHAKAGMTCIDCHTERELMGDGTLHRHAHEALDVSCEDCHQIAPRAASDPDREAVAQRLRASWGLRGLPPLPPGEPIRTRAGSPLWRTEAATGTLALVETGQRRRIPPASQAPHHELEGHARLSCQSCHTPWAPRCTSCHVRFDPNSEAVDHLSGQRTQGRWIETAGANGYGPPLLALGPRGKIVPFVEGMHLSVDLEPERPLRRDLWAPLDPHTTASARPCASCHDPARMDEVYPPRGELTRSGARLLDAAERAKIAKVGRCQSCHTGYDDPIWTDFAASNARLEGARHGVGKTDPKVRRCRAAAD